MAAAPDYREWRPAPGLDGLLACTWAGRLGDDGTPFTDRVLPDACIDLIWDGRRLFVAGPDTGPVPITREPGGVFAGVRFRPGLAPSVLGVPAVALLDQRVDAAEVWPDLDPAVVDRLAGAASLREAATVLEQAVIGRLPAATRPDRLVTGTVAALQAQPGTGARELHLPPPRHTTVAELAERLGVSERQLHRRCTAAVGYGPKVLDRVLRFRRFLHLVASPPGAGRPPGGLAGLAAAAGYADQSHLTRECGRLAGTTPGRLLGGAEASEDVRSVQDRSQPVP
jgi:AraC-like DNA-binding protein